MPVYVCNDDNSLWLAADCVTTLFRNTLSWKLESLNFCLHVKCSFVFHFFLLLSVGQF